MTIKHLSTVTRGLILTLALSGCLSGCTTLLTNLQNYNIDLQAAAKTANLPLQVELKDVPFFPQETNQCGPAALATLLNHVGQAVSPEQLVGQVYLPQRAGSLQTELMAATRRAGLVAYELLPNSDEWLKEVAAGHPVLILENLRFSFYPQWHYAVIVGYDLQANEVILRSGSIRQLVVPMTQFMAQWRGGRSWGFVALKADQLPASAMSTNNTSNQAAARYLQAVTALERVAPDAALTAYQTALHPWPDELAALIGLGNLYYQKKQWVAAEQQYRRATQVHPTSVDAFNNLAQVLLDQQQWQTALQAAQMAVSLGGVRIDIYQATLKQVTQQMALHHQ